MCFKGCCLEGLLLPHRRKQGMHFPAPSFVCLFPCGAESRLGFLVTSQPAKEVALGVSTCELYELRVWTRLSGEQFLGSQMASLLHCCMCQMTYSIHLRGLQILACGKRQCQVVRNWCCHRHRPPFVITGLMQTNY